MNHHQQWSPPIVLRRKVPPGTLQVLCSLYQFCTRRALYDPRLVGIPHFGSSNGARCTHQCLDLPVWQLSTWYGRQPCWIVAPVGLDGPLLVLETFNQPALTLTRTSGHETSSFVLVLSGEQKLVNLLFCFSLDVLGHWRWWFINPKGFFLLR